MNQFQLEMLKRGMVPGGAQGGRMAGSSLAGFLPTKVGMGATALGVGVPIGLAALGQLAQEENPGDPGGNLVRNVGGASGAVAGGLGGAALGAKVGTMIFPGAGSALGALVGGGLGATFGSGAGGGAGRGLAGSVYDLARGTPEDRAVRQAVRSTETLARSQLGLQQEAFPLQVQQAQLMQQIAQDNFNAQVAARARDTYQQALLGAATPMPGAYADPSFMQALAMAGRIG